MSQQYPMGMVLLHATADPDMIEAARAYIARNNWTADDVKIVTYEGFVKVVAKREVTVIT